MEKLLNFLFGIPDFPPHKDRDEIQHPTQLDVINYTRLDEFRSVLKDKTRGYRHQISMKRNTLIKGYFFDEVISKYIFYDCDTY